MKAHTGFEAKNPMLFININLLDVTAISPKRYIVLTGCDSEIAPPIYVNSLSMFCTNDFERLRLFYWNLSVSLKNSTKKR